MSEVIKNNSIFVVFSKTPYKMGRFIRKITHSKYNHVSVSFDEGLNEMYSFARYYKSTPFYGGFVRESLARFIYRGAYSEVLVCRIPVTDEQLEKAKLFVSELEGAEKYRYNLFSAMFYPFKRRVKINKAYTCVEFVMELFHYIGMTAKCEKKGFCATDELAIELGEQKYYCGDISKFLTSASWDDKAYFEKKNIFQQTKLTFASGINLIKMLFAKKA